jgi:DNA/RNA endonuclease YhcR with UshA esterase domain
MKTWLVIVSVVAMLLAASTGVGFWMLSDTKAELADIKAELAEIKGDSAPPVTSPAPTSDCDSEDAISCYEAKNHIGERTTVYGTVVSTNYASGSSGKPTFLNMCYAYPNPNRFTVVIWDDNRSKFPQPPEDYYYAKTIYVSGLIVLYDGVPEIEVTSPDQICEP